MTVFIYEYVTAQGEHHDVRLGCSPSLVTEGRAMRDAIVEDFRRVPGVEVCTMTRADTQETFQSFASRCDDSLIIAPEFDGILETRCRWVIEAGGRLLGPSPKAVCLTADKLAMYHHFHSRGISTPTTWRPVDAPAQYPQVWKPQSGAGSQATFLIRNADEIEPAIKLAQQEGQDVGEMIVQPMLSGTPASVAFLAGRTSLVPFQPSYQWLSDDGRFRYRGGACPIEAGLVDRAINIAGSALKTIPGLLGYVGVDILLGENPSEDYVIEVNPRLTTSYVGLRHLANFNIAEAMLNIATAGPRRQLNGTMNECCFNRMEW